jgi:hypothetical protein
LAATGFARRRSAADCRVLAQRADPTELGSADSAARGRCVDAASYRGPSPSDRTDHRIHAFVPPPPSHVPPPSGFQVFPEPVKGPRSSMASGHEHIHCEQRAHRRAATVRLHDHVADQQPSARLGGHPRRAKQPAVVFPTVLMCHSADPHQVRALGQRVTKIITSHPLHARGAARAPNDVVRVARLRVSRTPSRVTRGGRSATGASKSPTLHQRPARTGPARCSGFAPPCRLRRGLPPPLPR